MALSLNKLVYDVKNMAYGGVSSDDAKISDNQIAYWIKTERSMLLSQMMGKKLRVPASCVETLDRVYLDVVDAAEACEVDLGVHVLKSRKPLPRTVQRNHTDSILAVESLDGERPFSETTTFRRKWNKYNKYTSSKNRWYIKDNHLYVSCDILIEAVKVTGVFEDAEEVWLHNRCFDDYIASGVPAKSCDYDWDTPFPISMSLASQATDLIMQKRIQVTLTLPNDETNNAKGDGAQQMQATAKQ